MELADRVVVMSQGLIEQVGTPDEIYDRPNSPFVFSFIGEASELPVTVSSGKVLFEGLPIDVGCTDKREGPARLFMRPNGIDVVPERPGTISGEVAAVRRSGSWRRVEVLVGSARHRIEVELPADAPHDLSARIAVLPRYCKLYPAG
jgi:sulfate transport system ATP-binding protein